MLSAVAIYMRMCQTHLGMMLGIQDVGHHYNLLPHHAGSMTECNIDVYLGVGTCAA